MIILPKDERKGFTLIELLVVMMLIGILAFVGIANYQTSLMRARDAKRKGDLKNIAQALDLYWADNDRYPMADGGQIKPCTSYSGAGSGCYTIAWGGSVSFIDSAHQATIYMKLVPKDPSSTQSYMYSVSTDGKAYKVWAKLEISTDQAVLANNTNCSGYGGLVPACGSAGSCNMAVTSNNVSVCSDSGLTFQ